MYNLRTEIVKAILSSLRIDNNPFNQQIVKDKMEHIKDEQLQDFYGNLFNEFHQYLNGLDRVAKVAEQFKSNVIEIDEIEQKAKKLIELAHSMNNAVYQDHIRTGKSFDDLLNAVKFPNLSKEDEAVLNNVKPYCSLKALIGNINAYQTSKEQLEAFKNALKCTPSDVMQIANPIQKLRIKR